MIYGQTISSKFNFNFEIIYSKKGEAISEFIQKIIEESVVHSCTTITVENITSSLKTVAADFIFNTISNLENLRTFLGAEKITSSIPVSYDEVSIRNITFESFQARRNSGRFRLPFAPMRRSISMSKNEDLPSNHHCVAHGNATRHGITYQMVGKEKSLGTKR